LTKQPEKDSNGKEKTEFKCKFCDNKEKYKDGAYVCALCKYVVHENCANFVT